MNSAVAVIETFAKKWNVNQIPELADDSEIEKAEKILNIAFPNSYKYLVRKHGNIYAPDTLEVITDNALDLLDVQNFILPLQAIEDTRAFEGAGMPPGFIAIANDCMGNFFCYRLTDCQSPETEAPIWFFDHDFVEVERIFDNLEQWLGSYAAL